MDLGGVEIGDGGGMDMKISNKVYNNLKTFSNAEQKRAARLNDKHEKSTSTMAIDPRSRLILFRLVDNNIVDRINGVISTGKEAVILHAEGGKNEEILVPAECAIKVFKTTLNEFKTRDKYIADDYRFKNRFSKQNPRKIIHMWAEKEMHNLTRMRSVGLPCPEVVLLKKHILLMYKYFLIIIFSKCISKSVSKYQGLYRKRRPARSQAARGCTFYRRDRPGLQPDRRDDAQVIQRMPACPCRPFRI